MTFPSVKKRISLIGEMVKMWYTPMLLVLATRAGAMRCDAVRCGALRVRCKGGECGGERARAGGRLRFPRSSALTAPPC
jgi:hypothetical protein